MNKPTVTITKDEYDGLDHLFECVCHWAVECLRANRDEAIEADARGDVALAMWRVSRSRQQNRSDV
jgi:hypothetical protein